jgi:hypothetical protein
MQLTSPQDLKHPKVISDQVTTSPALHGFNPIRAIGKLLAVVLMAVCFNALPQGWWTVSARADEVPDLTAVPADGATNTSPADNPNAKLKAAADPCLAAVPVPTAKIGLHRVVQLVNCSRREAVLGAADAAQQLGKQQLPVLPREGTWIMQPFKPGDARHANVLTIDIPLGWENTACPSGAKTCVGIVGPRLWARTGCRYDRAFDIAQCETGGCSGRYDCSAARLTSSVGTVISEWTFAQPVSNGSIQYLKDSHDISAVDGVNMNLDIQPVGSSPHDPFVVPPDWSLPKNHLRPTTSSGWPSNTL